MAFADVIAEKAKGAGIELLTPGPYGIQQPRLSKAERQGGAWAWFLVTAEGVPTRPGLGSTSTPAKCAGEIVFSKERWGDYHVDPKRT